jgi:GNAT superfamily N-acetyltransferase
VFVRLYIVGVVITSLRLWPRTDTYARRMAEVEIRNLSEADADDEFVAHVVDLVNRVYAEAEEGIWRDGATRTNAQEVAAIIRAGQLAVARLNGQLVGAVRVQRLSDSLGEFGMLVAAPEHRGAGIGRRLVAFAERWARDQGLRRIQLELLVPRTWSHPVKEFLRDWYTRIGYRPVRTGCLETAYPALEPQLATPCDFVIYHKNLEPPRPRGGSTTTVR